MKKLYLTFLSFFLCSISLQAQVNFGLKAGLNLAKLAGDWDYLDDNSGIDYSPKFKAGLYVGLLLEVPLSETFFFQPELLFSMKGVKFQDDFKDTQVFPDGIVSAEGDFKLLYELNYIELPLLYKYKSSGGFEIGAGPYIGILTSAKGKIELNYEYTQTSFGVTTSGTEKESDSEDLTQYFKTIDIGIAGGVAYQFPFGLGIEARYTRGFMDVNEQKSEEGAFTNSVLQFGLRYLIVKKD